MITFHKQSFKKATFPLIRQYIWQGSLTEWILYSYVPTERSHQVISILVGSFTTGAENRTSQTYFAWRGTGCSRKIVFFSNPLTPFPRSHSTVIDLQKSQCNASHSHWRLFFWTTNTGPVLAEEGSNYWKFY